MVCCNHTTDHVHGAIADIDTASLFAFSSRNIAVGHMELSTAYTYHAFIIRLVSQDTTLKVQCSTIFY